MQKISQMPILIILAATSITANGQVAIDEALIDAATTVFPENLDAAGVRAALDSGASQITYAGICKGNDEIDRLAPSH